MIKTIAGIAVFAILLVGGVWIRLAAPCSWFRFGSIHEVPARCLTVVRR